MSSATLDAGGAAPDLNALWEEHMSTEFKEKSAAAAVATMVPHATVNHVPVMTGGAGTQALYTFYNDHFIPKMPADTELTPVDRIFGANTVVDHFVFKFTHNTEMDWMLPGVAPTGRSVKVPFVVIIKFEGDKLLSESIMWDHACVLVQLGLLDPAGLPVTGGEQADKLLEMAQGGGPIPSNALINAAAHK